MPGWGELYDGWEKDIPPQYEHRGPSLAEEAEAREVHRKSNRIHPWYIIENDLLIDISDK